MSQVLSGVLHSAKSRKTGGEEGEVRWGGGGWFSTHCPQGNGASLAQARGKHLTDLRQMQPPPVPVARCR